jgi:hypothetical protein
MDHIKKENRIQGHQGTAVLMLNSFNFKCFGSYITKHLPLPPQVYWTLLHNHFTVLLLPRMFRSGSLLFGTHWHSSWEATDTWRTWHLVVRWPYFAHHWRADAQWWQQLVHYLLKRAAVLPWGTDLSAQLCELKILLWCETWTSLTSLEGMGLLRRILWTSNFQLKSHHF